MRIKTFKYKFIPNRYQLVTDWYLLTYRGNIMQKKQIRQELVIKHSPTLNTILMVEDTLKNMEDSLITIAGLKKILPRKVNHNTLKEILDYLDKSNKIYINVKGIAWVQNDNPNLRKAIRESTYH